MVIVTFHTFFFKNLLPKKFILISLTLILSAENGYFEEVHLNNEKT